MKERKLYWIKLINLFCITAIAQLAINIGFIKPVQAQKSTPTTNTCMQITLPLTAEEELHARTAWLYFLKNFQPTTGFTNSTAGYPSGSFWDMGNYLMALNAARGLNLISQADFDYRLNTFLTTLTNLKLFENSLPNKVYNAKNAQMVDYTNKSIEKGIGWSALDIGRMLTAMHLIRSCHPEYADWMQGIISKWEIKRLIKDGQLYGAIVLPNGKTKLVQEGRLGYEEYAAKGFELWGYKVDKAVALEPFKFVDIYGIKIPVDTRDYKKTKANNYVVSESYILEGIEFGLKGRLQDFARRILEVQKRRYEQTGQLTAVTEDNIDKPPYFIYNTIYANGKSWAPITENNEPIPLFRSISTKAAFGWRYLYPNNTYAKKVFDAVKNLHSLDGIGFYGGLYESKNQPNKSITGNTNGLILEILHYKARGHVPMIQSDAITISNNQENTDIKVKLDIAALAKIEFSYSNHK
ncbi:MAG: DUF3131 domain-containing protein [Scytonematopsis contorta HA4267-MV1]|jgi:hypothetical protein|nr:DUF3131 domain-containing protein [Scytonematopsis contorta HA4267-MV1]